jgi:hypothetical protein
MVRWTLESLCQPEEVFEGRRGKKVNDGRYGRKGKEVIIDEKGRSSGSKGE